MSITGEMVPNKFEPSEHIWLVLLDIDFHVAIRHIARYKMGAVDVLAEVETDKFKDIGVVCGGPYFQLPNKALVFD